MRESIFPVAPESPYLEIEHLGQGRFGDDVLQALVPDAVLNRQDPGLFPETFQKLGGFILVKM